MENKSVTTVDGMEISLRWAPFTQEHIPAFEARCHTVPGQVADDFVRTLSLLLRIQVMSQETAYYAWCKAMHRENGLTFSFPIDPRLREAIVKNNDCHRFMYILTDPSIAGVGAYKYVMGEAK